MTFTYPPTKFGAIRDVTRVTDSVENHQLQIIAGEAGRLSDQSFGLVERCRVLRVGERVANFGKGRRSISKALSFSELS